MHRLFGWRPARAGPVRGLPRQPHPPHHAPFGTDLLFECDSIDGYVLGVEVCEDLWMPVPPSSLYAVAGATVLANVSASNETIGKAAYRQA